MANDAKPTVFVVDDNQASRDSLVELLESVGLTAQTFPSAQDFLTAYDAEQPGCLVLDVRMRGMSGLDLQDRLMSQRKFIPIVFITGHGDVPMAVRAMKSGAVDFLEKPFNDQALLDCVHRALARDTAQRHDKKERKEARTRLQDLTPREREVLGLMVEGLPNKVVAIRLGISRKTLDIHRANIFEKTGSESLVELARLVQLSEATPGPT